MIQFGAVPVRGAALFVGVKNSVRFSRGVALTLKSFPVKNSEKILKKGG